MSEQPPHQTGPPTIHYSPDGQYWWDGHAWRPVSAIPSGPQTTIVTQKGSNPFVSGMAGCFGVGCAILLVFGLLFASCTGIVGGSLHGASNSISSPGP